MGRVPDPQGAQAPRRGGAHPVHRPVLLRDAGARPPRAGHRPGRPAPQPARRHAGDGRARPPPLWSGPPTAWSSRAWRSSRWPSRRRPRPGGCPPSRRQAQRAAARAAARRRRRILAVLLLLVAGVLVAAYLGYLTWWSAAVPGGLTVLYLVLCRTQVRGETARDVPDLLAPAEPQQERTETPGQAQPLQVHEQIVALEEPPVDEHGVVRPRRGRHRRDLRRGPAGGAAADRRRRHAVGPAAGDPADVRQQAARAAHGAHHRPGRAGHLDVRARPPRTPRSRRRRRPSPTGRRARARAAGAPSAAERSLPPGTGTRFGSRRTGWYLFVSRRWDRRPGAVAQLVARLVRNEKVRGSNPLSSTTREPRPPAGDTAGGRGSLVARSVAPGGWRAGAECVPMEVLGIETPCS